MANEEANMYLQQFKRNIWPWSYCKVLYDMQWSIFVRYFRLFIEIEMEICAKH